MFFSFVCLLVNIVAAVVVAADVPEARVASLLLAAFAAYLAKFCAISKMTGTKQNVRGNTNVSLPLPGAMITKAPLQSI